LEDVSGIGWTFRVEEERTGAPLCAIKRLKNTNQLKIELIENSTSPQFSVLSECKLKHLIGSDTFSRYFECTNEEIFANFDFSPMRIKNFYIIEENSIFHIPSIEQLKSYKSTIVHS
jgi:hypothetical protein